MFWITEKLMFGMRQYIELIFVVFLCELIRFTGLLQELGMCPLWIDAWIKPIRDGILENAN
jgi:hypothetical protein